MAKLTYRKSGVDINKANRLIDKIKPLVASTKRSGWMGNIGSFAGFFNPNIKRYKNPILVASTDGVGTKLKVAQAMDKHDTVGIDLVAMCVNDLVSCGAEPLIFLDYFASGKLKSHVMYEVMKGVVKGCRLSNSALIGGETAELPGMYADGVYDIAGFSVGVVEKNKIIDGRNIKSGDVILGISSSGLHSNGFSMVRKVFSMKALRKSSLGRGVLTPTTIYVKPILDLIKNFKIKGIANITGGGFYDNVIRVLPRGVASVIFKRSWDVPSIFKKIQKQGNVNDAEMYKTFNMGIGMVCVVSAGETWKVVNLLKKKYKLDSWRIGEIVKGKRRVELIDL